MTELLFKEEVYAIVGAAMAVYNELGSGFLEAVYQEALEIELRDRGISFESQTELRIIYKGRPLKKTYICDLLCYGKIMVELKSEERLTSKDRGQLHNYLKATGLEVGLLLNFGNYDKLEWERWVHSQKFAQIRGRPMADFELRPDNWRTWPVELFDREDPAPDEQFYLEPRKVVHIDLYAIQAVTDLYRELVPANGVVLDLMSAWRSHLPTEVKYQRVVGLGMNVDEMADNPELNKFVVHNLNSGEPLPFENNTFDAALCAVSVQYLTRPVETFTEVARVLRPGAPFIVTFSNRCFPTKAINLWLHADDQAHMQIVALYFLASGQFDNIVYQDRSPGSQFDPLYAVWGRKRKAS